MGWWIFFGILVLLAILPIGIRIRYDEDGFTARVILGIIRIQVFPIPDWLKRKPKKPEQKEGKSEEPAAVLSEAPAQGKPQAEKKKGGSAKDFLALIPLAIQFLGDFRRKLRLNHLRLKLILAGDDPCDVAVNYGRAWALMADLLPALERYFVIRKRDIEVECDFTSDEIRITAGLDITITIGRLLSLAVVYGIQFLKAFLTIKKKQESGVET